MKTTAGTFLPACSNRSRTRAAPTPTNNSTNSEADTSKQGTLASPAKARASSVFPEPGGPSSSTPRGRCAPAAPHPPEEEEKEQHQKQQRQPGDQEWCPSRCAARVGRLKSDAVGRQALPHCRVELDPDAVLISILPVH